MNTKNYYLKFREVGQRAQQALRNAKILEKFRELEYLGFVRVRLEPEHESYFDIFGKPDTKEQEKYIRDFIEQYGLWYMVGEYSNNQGQWEQTDSIGMLLYENPLCPFQNDYFTDIAQSCIQETIKFINNQTASF